MNTDDDINGKDLEFQVEKLLDHSQFDLSRLPLLKSQLDDINSLEQPDLYSEKLSKLEQTISSCFFIFSYLSHGRKMHL